MTQYYSRKDYEYAGDSNFTIPFSYISKDDINVYVNDEEITTWTWLNDSQINISSTLTTGDIVSIRRNTPIDEKIVTYQNMSMVLNDDNLNLSQDQILNAVQEMYDNNVTFEIEVEGDIDTIEETANTALSNSQTAITTANTADSKADTAISTANTANNKADNAVSTANSANSSATNAVNTANSAVNTANSASETATSASNKVDEFGQSIEQVIEAAEKINELEEAVQTATTAATTASNKADVATNKATEATNAADRAEAVIPTQTGQNGKYLKTNGTSTSWEDVDLSSKQDVLVSGTNIKTINNNSILGSGNIDMDSLPSQTGQGGKYLTTDGTDASWGDVDTGSSRNIGEIVASTIPLTDAGLHLLDGALISGSGSYSAFVDYMADVYDTHPIVDKPFVQPTLSANGIIGGNDFACFSSSEYSSDYGTYKAFNGIVSDLSSSYSYWCSSATSNQYIGFYNPVPIKVTNLRLYNQLYGGDGVMTGGIIEASNDNSVYTQIGSFSGNTFGVDYIDVDLSSNTEYYKYYRIVGASYSASYATMGEVEITATYKDSIIFCTEEQWQQSVTDYGVCGKFVYDSVNNTVRLPKITGFVEGTIDTATLGDLTEAGLPSIEHTHNASIPSSTKTAASGSARNQVLGSYTITTDINSSVSSIYGNSDTVQPQTIKVLYYIVIATSTKTDIEVDIDEIATDLNGKADKDLTNCVGSLSDSSRTYLRGLNSYGELDWSNKITLSTATASTSINYVLPDDGCLFVSAYCNGGSSNKQASAGISFYYDVDNNNTQSISYGAVQQTGSYVVHSSCAFGLKGQKFNLYTLATGASTNHASMIFVPLKKS